MSKALMSAGAAQQLDRALMALKVDLSLRNLRLLNQVSQEVNYTAKSRMRDTKTLLERRKIRHGFPGVELHVYRK